jgi:hypothetical protein
MSSVRAITASDLGMADNPSKRRRHKAFPPFAHHLNVDRELLLHSGAAMTVR